MIRIELDQRADLETYGDFSNLTVGGADFGKRIRATHPAITAENFQEYIRAYYQDNEGLLARGVRELQDAVDATSQGFFAAAREFFNEDYSQNAYVGALSIFDCNPRFVETQSFQVFFQRDLSGKVGVAYHEILHFVFFDYCERHCADAVRGRSSNGGSYWELSEILNVILLNQPAFQAIVGRPEKLFYPALAEIFPEIEKIWNDRSDMESFVEESLRVLDESKLQEK